MVTVFESIDNFRDLAESVQRRSRVCSKNIFRSATLDYATESDIDKLVAELRVNTILDLRSEVEAQISKMGKPFVSFPVATAMLKLNPSDMSDPDPEPSVEEKLDGPTRKTIMINFAGQKFRKYAVWKAAPLKLKMQIIGLIASGQKPRAVKLVGEEIIAKKGLTGLYRDFIDYCDQEICEALHVLADPCNYPVLVHCTQGKDRTGLVTALALAAAGIEEDMIIEDYSKSREGLARVRAHMVQEMAKDGLDPTFADAPPEVMKKTFDYIREKYSDVYGYLDYIGFGDKERAKLRKAMTFKAMQVEAQCAEVKTQAKRKTSNVSATKRNSSSPTRSDSDDQSSSSDSPDLGSDVSNSERKHSRARNLSTSSANSSDTDSGYGSPWSPDTREKPTKPGRPLGVPIGSRRTASEVNSNSTSKLKYMFANPRAAGLELLNTVNSGLGFINPLAEDKHHRRTTSDDVNNREATRDDGFLPIKLMRRNYSPVSTTESPPLKSSTTTPSPLGKDSSLDSTESSPSPSPPSTPPPPLPPKPRGLTTTRTPTTSPTTSPPTPAPHPDTSSPTPTPAGDPASSSSTSVPSPTTSTSTPSPTVDPAPSPSPSPSSPTLDSPPTSTTTTTNN